MPLGTYYLTLGGVYILTGDGRRDVTKDSF